MVTRGSRENEQGRVYKLRTSWNEKIIIDYLLNDERRDTSVTTLQAVGFRWFKELPRTSESHLATRVHSSTQKG